MSYLLSPICNEVQVDANGAPLSGGKIETYVAGSSTPAATYTSNTGGTPQANPVVLTVLGLPAQPIWLDSSITYKFIIKDVNGVVQRVVDNISGISGSTPLTPDQWVIFGGSPTYISATSFSLAGDQVSTFQVGRRVRTVNTGGIVYSTILTSVFGAVTTVTLSNDAGSLDSGLSQVAYGFLSSVDDSIPTTVAKQSYVNFTGVPEFQTAGTVPNYTLTPSPAITSYVVGQRFRVNFHAAGSFNPLVNYTLNVNGLGPKNILTYNTAGAGYVPPIPFGVIYDLEYNGTNFIVLNPVDGSGRVGEYIHWPLNSTPQHALLCNGAAVSRATYARLFSVLGTAYGVGDGSTTFNIPNIPAGYALTNSNGANAGTTTVGQNLNHTHNYSADSGVNNFTPGGSGGLFHLNGSPYGPTDTGTNSGSANLAAAMYSRICIIF